jgi:hypothetical protein
MAATDSRPVPRKGVAYRHYFSIRNTAGELVTTWAGQDSKVSLDGEAYADCTNEATEIGTSGTGYIDLTAAEMTADCLLYKLIVTNSDAVLPVFAIYPEEAGDYRVADTQKVDVQTIKTQTVTCAAGVTIHPAVGSDYKLGVESDGDLTKVNTLDGHTAVKIKIASTTGNWATAGTWADGVVPAAGDNIVIQTGITVTVAASLDLSQFGTLRLAGTGVLNIAEGATVARVNEGWTVTENAGTMTINYGTVSTNSGSVTNNSGTISNNSGTIFSNDGHVGSNSGTIDSNNGTINHNTGTVTYNNCTVAINYQTIAYNYGTVVDNNGTIVHNNGIIFINRYTITTNEYNGVAFNFNYDGEIGTDNGRTIEWASGVYNPQSGDAYAATLTNSSMLLAAEIATVTSQTVFTLATGSDQNDAYNQHEIVLYDDSNSDYTCRRTVLDYVGASKTVTIDSAPNFTLAADDSVKIFVAPSSRIKIVA